MGIIIAFPSAMMSNRWVLASYDFTSTFLSFRPSVRSSRLNLSGTASSCDAPIAIEQIPTSSRKAARKRFIKGRVWFIALGDAAQAVARASVAAIVPSCARGGTREEGLVVSLAGESSTFSCHLFRCGASGDTTGIPVIKRIPLFHHPALIFQLSSARLSSPGRFLLQSIYTVRESRRCRTPNNRRTPPSVIAQ